MISISTTHLASMRAHAEADYPHECCGGLLGTFDGENKVVTKTVPLENHWEDIPGEDKTRRFRITPEDYKMLEATAKSDGRLLLGFYHSHPDHPPIPSKTDLKFAWPFFSYPILSIKGGAFESIKSYELIGSKFIEEQISLT